MCWTRGVSLVNPAPCNPVPAPPRPAPARPLVTCTSVGHDEPTPPRPGGHRLTPAWRGRGGRRRCVLLVSAAAGRSPPASPDPAGGAPGTAECCVARLAWGGSGRAGDCRPYGRPARGPVGSWRRAAHLLWPRATPPPAAPPPAHTLRPPRPHALPTPSELKGQHRGPGEPRGAPVGRLGVNRWSMTRRAAAPLHGGSA